MATVLQNQDKRNFWFETKRTNNNHFSLSNVVDDARDDKDITNTFVNKYKHSYNSVSYDVNDMNVVKNIALSCKICAYKA